MPQPVVATVKVPTLVLTHRASCSVSSFTMKLRFNTELMNVTRRKLLKKKRDLSLQTNIMHRVLYDCSYYSR